MVMSAKEKTIKVRKGIGNVEVRDFSLRKSLTEKVRFEQKLKGVREPAKCISGDNILGRRNTSSKACVVGIKYVGEG